MKYIANAFIIFGLLWMFSEKETTETEFIFQIVGGLACLYVGSLIHSINQSNQNNK